MGAIRYQAVHVAGVASPGKVCSYQDVIDFLNLTRSNEVYTSARPVRDWTHPTVVYLDIYLYAILAVIEKSQIFTPFIWIALTWGNELISWDPSQFCGIEKLSIPKEMLWKPDLFIYEMTEEDNGAQSPYLYVYHDGTVSLGDDYAVASTCKMDVHKFPFDTQSCTITFSSLIYTVDDVQLFPHSNSSRATQASLEVIQSQGEWEFLNMSVTKTKLSLDEKAWDQLTYTITMRRRPLLHVINLLLPILFFLTLDIASFYISDKRGEKLDFKVTVLLAISVLLLILNDILPSMSNKTPLIATFCIVIFAFMLLSVLETILVTYLMEKDSVPARPVEDGSQSLSDDCEKTQEEIGCQHECKRSRCTCACVCGAHEEPQSEQQVHESLRLTDSQLLKLILGELQVLRHNLFPSDMGLHERKPLYWERVAKRINSIFFCFYLIAILLFLLCTFIEWMA
ncbi:5-hydroxytryptamine receptor 3A-like [Megalops cyprinoides]|uniref:5-hydroxytryptamine receptor 3A-like n=1 Tax=Megalops cyprinoides TaxID=118141 RepID=UPI001864D88D|nr:5-hydroxytryptamine receptor 3A-like [Megalops cyprinoides]